MRKFTMKGSIRLNLRIIISCFSISIYALALLVVKDYSFGGQIFPGLVCTLGLITCLFLLSREITESRTTDKEVKCDYVDIAVDDSIPARVAYARALHYLIWIIGLYGLIFLLGMKLAVVIFMATFLRVEAKSRWLIVCLFTAVVGYLVFFHFERLLSMHFPPYLLEPWLERLSIVF